MKFEVILEKTERIFGPGNQMNENFQFLDLENGSS